MDAAVRLVRALALVHTVLHVYLLLTSKAWHFLLLWPSC
jgi:hypothetical protein